MSKSLLDLMPKEEAEKAKERARRRIARQQSKRPDVTPEIYLVSELGYYFGWDAVLAARRGYTVDPITGEKEILTLEEIQVLLEGARKVWYSKLVEQSQVAIIGNTFRSSSKTFDGATKQFTERAEISE